MAFSSSLSIFFLLFFFLLAISSSTPPTQPLLSLLEDIQAAALASSGSSNFDPKTYVDLPLKRPLEEVSNAFKSLLSPSNETLAKFLAEYFDQAGSDLLTYKPQDYKASPDGFLPYVQSEEVRNWGLEVHALWLNLSRNVASSVKEFPDRHTLLFLPEPAVVPGSRFREVYYWDSYWVVRGLLVSKMYDTAKGIVLNLLSLVDRFGFVPNGARTYYENRSQPPLLAAMVWNVYLATVDIGLLHRALPVLIREHDFWTSDLHQIIIMDKEGHSHSLNRYYANWTEPRPESFTVDKKLAEGLPVDEQRHLYRDIATAAETGWDFSSRWMRDRKNLTTLQTSLIIPVDLNAYLLQMEDNIMLIATTIRNATVAKEFSDLTDNRRTGINAVLWNDDMGQWLDYILPSTGYDTQNDRQVYTWNEASQNRYTYASNFIPLWCGALNDGDYSKIHKVIDSLQNSGLIYPAGIMTSLNETGQQWDFPNAWAPLQHMIIEGLALSGMEKGRVLANAIAQSWVRTNYEVYKRTGEMLEKYDARTCGGIGGGGEYTIQAGFGWSNGVLLSILQRFGWPSDVSIICQ